MKPVAYVINLDRRKDRWEKVQQLWSLYFDLIRYPAVSMPENGARGCKLSHVALAASALTNHPTAIVLEDDAEPTEWFRKEARVCIEEANRYVDDWDCINCGAFLDLKPIGLPYAILSESPSPVFFKTTYSHNTHFVIYNQKSLKLLTESLKSWLPVDMYLGKHAKEQWVPIHLLARQYQSPSDIRKPHPGQHLLYDRTEAMLTHYESITQAHAHTSPNAT